MLRFPTYSSLIGELPLCRSRRTAQRGDASTTIEHHLLTRYELRWRRRSLTEPPSTRDQHSLTLLFRAFVQYLKDWRSGKRQLIDLTLAAQDARTRERRRRLRSGRGHGRTVCHLQSRASIKGWTFSLFPHSIHCTLLSEPSSAHPSLFTFSSDVLSPPSYYQMARFFALAALAMALVAHATPTPERRLLHMPREATRLAADPETGVIYLYDNRGIHLGAMEGHVFEAIQSRAGGCADISASEVQQRA